MIPPNQLAELVVLAGCARLEFAQDRNVADHAPECTVAQLVKLEVARSRAGSDARIVDPMRIHKAANDVVGFAVDQSDSKTTRKEVGDVLVVQLVLQ